MTQRLNSIGSAIGLRKFQKATNSLRRNNMVKNDVDAPRSQQHVPSEPRKNGYEHNMRRAATKYSKGGDLSEKIQELVRMSILQKYKQAMDSVLTENIDNASDDHTKPEYKFPLNDHISESNEVSLESEQNQDDELDEY